MLFKKRSNTYKRIRKNGLVITLTCKANLTTYYVSWGFKRYCSSFNLTSYPRVINTIFSSAYAVLPLLSIWFLTKYLMDSQSLPSNAHSALHFSQVLLRGTVPLLMNELSWLWTACLSSCVHETGSEQNKMKNDQTILFYIWHWLHGLMKAAKVFSSSHFFFVNGIYNSQSAHFNTSQSSFHSYKYAR